MQALQQHEVDLQNKQIMQNRQQISWPTAATIAKAQKRLTTKEKTKATQKTIEGRKLYTNAQGKIIIPDTAEKLQRILITLAHQDNHGHRSIEDSTTILRATFTFPKLKQKANELIHTCLQCLKLRGGCITPRPTWEMMRATVPFEYIHADYMDMPTATTGECYLMIITCDLSGTVLLHPCSTHQALDTARAIVNEWLSMYPDPTILHTDGGTHFVNSLIKAIADIRGFKHHITAPYNKKSHGVGERINRTCLDAYLAFLAQMELDEKTWPKYAKMIQAQINRTPTKSRGNKSPIEITTGIKPKSTFNHILFEGHDAVLKEKLTVASKAIEQHVQKFIQGLQQTWGDVARSRERKSTQNKKQHTKCSRIPTPQTLPIINIGDYVLVAIPVRASKLQFKWTGPWQVTDTVSNFVYECKPMTTKRMKPRPVHITRIRRFAGKELNITTQLQNAIDRDAPPNEVQKIIAHKTNKADGELHLKVQWLGFTKEEQSWEPAWSLHEYVPGHVRAYTHDNKQHKICRKFFEDNYS